MSDFADFLIGLVREHLRQHPAFAAARRDDFDLYLADLENDFRHELEQQDAATEREAYEQGRADAEDDMAAAGAAAAAAEAKRKSKHKPKTAKQPEAATP
jgi:hypothetical protein